ncbi:hypothetical protein E0L36_16230 [Streptomyces sp. AJS327]|uniref:hypothetical protein n=1 Tax=Streptomyces sp. AJS327 TaxID=2545265 RepID=UPI0015E04CFC|nr:hypothetical protein [Streptomyces sp. AJS327]MBA0052402.1 hypothetical protein [Streptomyces sp. AJS327]
MSNSADGATYATLSPAERKFVDTMAAHYRETHGAGWETARVVSWMMISDPVEQSLTSMARAIDATPDQIEHIVEHLEQAGLYERIEGSDGETRYRLTDDGYPKTVAATLASWPRFHEIFQFGLGVLEGESEERRQRVAELEELFGHVVSDLADMTRRWEEREGTTVS